MLFRSRGGLDSAPTEGVESSQDLRADQGGPADDWSFPSVVAQQLGISPRVKGTTWTLVSDRVPCSFAMQKTPALLEQWSRTKAPGRMVPGLAGWTCAKDRGYIGYGGKGSPEGSCLKAGKLFSLIESGPYTLARIKQLATTGKLPTR